MSDSLSEVDRLTRVLVKHPREAFVDEGTIAAQWRSLGFVAPPSLAGAVSEFDAFIDVIRAAGAQIDFLPRDEQTDLDSIYARDASVVCSRGVILCRMGKRLRANEPSSQEVAFTRLGMPIVYARRVLATLACGPD